jgi:hypothetical protein
MVRIAGGAAAAALLGAIFCDVAGTAGALPAGWPVVSYTLVAVAVAAATAATLMRVLTTRTGENSRPLLTLAELTATGVLLGSWLLRGHPEIPPDQPLVAAQVIVVIVFAGVALRRWRLAARAPRA